MICDIIKDQQSKVITEQVISKKWLTLGVMENNINFWKETFL